MCFFFKQKTAYEMRISDWSSDVCSSDLAVTVGQQGEGPRAIAHLDAVVARDPQLLIEEARPATPRLDDDAAPELHLAVDHERLAAEDGHEANALLGQPQKSGEGLGDQPLAERAIRAIADRTSERLNSSH